MYDYYKIDKNNPIPIKEVIRRWVEDKDKAYDATIHGYYTTDEVYPYREYTWRKELSRRSLEEWEELKAEMSRGWNPKDPILLAVGQDGNAKIGEGNHRLGIAKELGMPKVPVRFVFQSQVHKSQDPGLIHKNREEWLAREKEKAQKREQEKLRKRQINEEADRAYEALSPEEKKKRDEDVDRLLKLLMGKEASMKKEAQIEQIQFKQQEIRKLLNDNLTAIQNLLNQPRPNIPQIVGQINNITNRMNEAINLKVREIASLKTPAQTGATPAADDAKDRHLGPRGKKQNKKLPDFWRRNLDYGESPYMNLDRIKKITDRPKLSKRRK